MNRLKSLLPASAVAIFCLALPPKIPARDDQALLRTREAVWRAWFAGDEQALRRLVPPDTIVLSASEKNWQSQSDVLRDARQFHAGGGKLISLSFPRTAVQRFGPAAFLYSDYVMEFSENGKRSIVRGRATEVFVLRDGKWVNPGWHTDTQ